MPQPTTKPTCEMLTRDLDRIKELQKIMHNLLSQAKSLSPDLSDPTVHPLLRQAWQVKTELERETKELQDHLWPFEHLSFNSVKEQYESQQAIFTQIGILKRLSDGRLGIKGVDDKEYPFPTLQQIKQKLKENKEKIDYKTSQGFTRLQLTPFAMPLPDLAEIVKTQILKHHEQKQLFTAKQDPHDSGEPLIPLDLDTTDPLFVWEDYHPDKLFYRPKQLTTKDHGGQTKAEILATQKEKNHSFPGHDSKWPLGGWDFKLLEDNLNLPAPGQGQTIGDRPQLEAGQKAREYYKIISPDPTKEPDSLYRHESGLTPEDWLTLFVTHLHQTNQVIDDYQSYGKGCYLLGAWFPSSGDVGYADWDLGAQLAYLSRSNPVDSVGFRCSRSAVRVCES